MGTYWTADPSTKIFTMTSAPVSGEVYLDVRKWLYSDLKVDWLNDASLNKFYFPVTPLGGNPLTGSLFLGSYYFLEYGWKIRPYEADHRFIIDGNLFSRDGSPITVPTLGAYNVEIQIINSALAYAVAGDAQNISAAVWNSQRADHVIVDSFGEKVGRQLNLTEEADSVWREVDD